MLSNTTFTFFVVFIITYICDANDSFDFPGKCSIKDGECHQKVLSSFVRVIAKTGIPALDIPPLDPYEVKDKTISILGMLDITMTEGTVEGTTNCTFTKFETNFEERYTYTESFCDNITISGHYKIQVGPVTQSLFGEPVSGDGIGSIQIENMVLKMKIPYSIEMFDDDKIYLVPKVDEAEYATDDVQKISFSLDNLWIGSREISGYLTNYLNENWSSILTTYGKLFSDGIMKAFYQMLKDFFLAIPASKLVKDDLSAYV